MEDCRRSAPITENTKTSSGNERERRIKKLESSGIYKRYQPCTFENMERKNVPQQIRKAFSEAKKYADNFSEYEKKGIGVILIGPVGTMKTSMAVGIAQELISKNKGVMFLPMAELFDKLVYMSKQKDNTEFNRFESRLKNTSLLILDDLGTEYPNDWIRNKVDAIISFRYNSMKPICVTTNLTPGDIVSRYQERVYDRLKGSSIIIGINSQESLRKVPGNLRG